MADLIPESGDVPDPFPRYRDPVARVCVLLWAIVALLVVQIILGLF